MDEILISENLRPDPVEFAQVCFGRSDRTCLRQLLTRRGRVVSKEYLDKLLQRKASSYIQSLSTGGKLPLYPGLHDFLYQLKAAKIALVLVTGVSLAEVNWVLSQANLTNHFAVMVTGEEFSAEQDKPAAGIYHIAIARLNQYLPQLATLPSECLAVEASFAGITAAKQASIPVVGVAHCYPYRMMQRRANWAVDYLNDIDLGWIKEWYEPGLIANREISQ